MPIIDSPPRALADGGVHRLDRHRLRRLRQEAFEVGHGSRCGLEQHGLVLRQHELDAVPRAEAEIIPHVLRNGRLSLAGQHGCTHLRKIPYHMASSLLYRKDKTISSRGASTWLSAHATAPTLCKNACSPRCRELPWFCVRCGSCLS